MTLGRETTLWPTQNWERRILPEPFNQQIDSIATSLFTLPDDAGHSLGLFVTQGGRCVYERYAEGVDANTVLPSWSMAKSIVHALVGILVLFLGYYKHCVPHPR